MATDTLQSRLVATFNGTKFLTIPFVGAGNTGVGNTSPFGLQIPLIDFASDNDFSSTANFTLGGVSGTNVFTYCNNFTINSGHQMTVPGLRVIYCNTFTPGGNGIVGTTASTVQSYIKQFHQIPSVGGYTNPATLPTGFGAGGGAFDHSQGNTGSAGSSEQDGLDAFPVANYGGGGGGATGNGGQGRNGSTTLQGASAGGLSSQSMLIVICDTAVLTTANTINFAGANATAATANAGGGGGGLGGNVFVFARTSIDYSGVTINVSGGNAANGANGTSNESGGGGGGGGHSGLIWLQAPSLTGGGTLTANGGLPGTGGTGAGTGTAAQDGTAGYAQEILTIAQSAF